MQGPIRPGYSACRENSISGVGKTRGAYCELWGWITDIRNLRYAWRTVASNKGKRTPGVDGVTVKHIHRQGVDAYLEGVRRGLKDHSYVPSPARRV